MRFELDIIIEPDGDGFHAYSPSLPGLHTCGQTEEEAIENAKNAALAYIESMIKHGEPLPIGSKERPPRKHMGFWPFRRQPDVRIKSVELAVP